MPRRPWPLPVGSGRSCLRPGQRTPASSQALLPTWVVDRRQTLTFSPRFRLTMRVCCTFSDLQQLGGAVERVQLDVVPRELVGSAFVAIDHANSRVTDQSGGPQGVHGRDRGAPRGD